MTATLTASRFLTFAIDGDVYAIPLQHVREVVSCKTVVRVPNAGEALRGLMNLRGNVVPVIDLAHRLGAGLTTLTNDTCAVLIDADIDGEQIPVAGLVEEIRGVVDLADDSILATPAFGTPIDARLVRGVVSEGKRFAYILALDQVFNGIA